MVWVALRSSTLMVPPGVGGTSACHSVRDVSVCSRRKIRQGIHLRWLKKEKKSVKWKTNFVRWGCCLVE